MMPFTRTKVELHYIFLIPAALVTLITVQGFVEIRQVNILFDELHYDESNRSFIVYCIDQPLLPRQDSVENEELRHVAESAVR